MAAAYRVRYRWHGNRVHLNFLVNAKSGFCGEDCGYCSQSKTSTAAIARYGMLDPEEIFDGACIAAERQAGTYCIVISGRTPADSDLDRIAEIVPRIKAAFALRILRVGGSDEFGASRSAQDLRRGPCEPQPQYQSPVLSSHLHDPQL